AASLRESFDVRVPVVDAGRQAEHEELGRRQSIPEVHFPDATGDHEGVDEPWNRRTLRGDATSYFAPRLTVLPNEASKRPKCSNRTSGCNVHHVTVTPR